MLSRHGCKQGRQKGEETLRLDTPIAAGAALAVILSATPLAAQTVRGVTATEIKIGQTMPYSGPISAFGALALPSYAYE
jgi:hypothetical protein